MLRQIANPDYLYLKSVYLTFSFMETEVCFVKVFFFFSIYFED